MIVLKKLKVSHDSPINYYSDWIPSELINEFIGKEVSIKWSGRYVCQSCSKTPTKLFGEGLCYSCFKSSPIAAPCILHPEKCRAHLGEGRDVEWEIKYHLQPHLVYLAVSDVVKVGVTKHSQVPIRWIDQGAIKAIKLAETSNRYEAGCIEVALKETYTDKTNWRKMVKNEVDPSIDLIEEKWSLHEELPFDMQGFFSEDDTVYEFNYPVEKYPEKIIYASLDKQNEIKGTLRGIKGQYLLFDNGMVFNVRRHTGYEVIIT